MGRRGRAAEEENVGKGRDTQTFSSFGWGEGSLIWEGISLNRKSFLLVSYSWGHVHCG